MAIIQISKIQQRSGDLVDLPQLDEAQFGWANDAKRLFIGASAPNPIENVEVLTSYSTISFSQVEGSGNSNVNITTPIQPGQILAYDTSTNSWINTGGNANAPGNSSQYAGVPIHLGAIANVKIGGGATGYILETDGQGNLNWTSKGTLYTNIVALSNSTPIVMTVANTTPYTNGSEITISGVNGIANSNVNSLNFYVKLSNDYPSSGNVSLYTDISLTANSNGTSLTYTNSPNAIATSTSAGSGAANAGGSVNSIQFNDSGVLNGSANFTITGGNTVSLSGSFSATTITGPLTTAAQPNVTSVGTLSGLVVAGNITPSANITYNLGNNTNRFNDLYLANSTIYLGSQTIGANITSVSISGQLVANIVGNISGNATTAGTVTTAAQPNITSVGTLTSLSSSGNITGANITGTHYGAATGLTSIPGANVSGAVSFATTANAVAGANVSGAVSFATTANAVAGANVSGAVSFATTANAVAGANVSGTVSSATTAGTVTTAAQPNITSVGTLTSVSVTGNSTTGGIKTDNYYYANGVSISFAGSYSNSNVAAYLPTYTGQVGTGAAIHYGTTLTTGSNSTAGVITGNWSLTAGSRLNATYADLAEYYEADAIYLPGTVLAFGGDKEVTIAEDGTNKVAGVVSTDPAYVMNMKCKGEHIVALALQGRVPTKVRGTIHKGDMLVSGGDGYARPSASPQMGTVIGKALENFIGEGIIEVAVGRL
jgi:hypothetical protein